MTLAFEVWADDKRCPSTVECAEAGPVRVQAALWREGHSTAFPVFTVFTDPDGNVQPEAPGSDNEIKVGPYRVAVTAVTPYPSATARLPFADYAATFVVNKDPTALPDTDADMRVVTDSPFKLAPGELVTLVGREVALRVDSVADSRCPGTDDPECQSPNGGTVEVALTWLENGVPPRPIHLTAHTDETGKILPPAGSVRPMELVDGAGIRLVRVEPFPVAGQATPQGDFRVTLTLEAGPRMPPGSEFAEPGESFTLTPEHTAVIGPDLLRVRFDAVVEDLRCPREVLCVTAGTVQVGVTVASPNVRATTYLLGGSTDDQGVLLPAPAIVHDGYTLRLEQVTPYPERADAPIPADGYSATFVVEAPASAVAAPSVPVPAAVASDAAQLPLLCVNFRASRSAGEGAPAEDMIRFTAPLSQDAATDYGQAHALCNGTFGAEWMQAGPTDADGVAAYLPADEPFWVWDGMAGGLVRYARRLSFGRRKTPPKTQESRSTTSNSLLGMLLIS